MPSTLGGNKNLNYWNACWNLISLCMQFIVPVLSKNVQEKLDWRAKELVYKILFWKMYGNICKKISSSWEEGHVWGGLARYTSLCPPAFIISPSIPGFENEDLKRRKQWARVRVSNIEPALLIRLVATLYLAQGITGLSNILKTWSEFAYFLFSLVSFQPSSNLRT